MKCLLDRPQVLHLRLLRRQREALRGQEQPPPQQVRVGHAAKDRPYRHPARKRLKGAFFDSRLFPFDLF